MGAVSWSTSAVPKPWARAPATAKTQATTTIEKRCNSGGAKRINRSADEGRMAAALVCLRLARIKNASVPRSPLDLRPKITAKLQANSPSVWKRSYGALATGVAICARYQLGQRPMGARGKKGRGAALRRSDFDLINLPFRRCDPAFSGARRRHPGNLRLRNCGLRHQSCLGSLH